MTHFSVDELEFEVRRSGRRKTMEIIIDRAGELVLAVPQDAGEEKLTEFVREKRFWIYKKLTEKASLNRPVPRKEYMDGEGFLYLGRSYRLKLVDDQEEPLKLVAGRLQMRRDLISDGRQLLIDWYSARGKDWLAAKANLHAANMGVSHQGVKVQDLGYRWGSCGKGGVLYFHWKTIMLPREIAEYVVVHELVHLEHPHHTPSFWMALERAMPDYERRKQWLAKNGAEVGGF